MMKISIGFTGTRRGMTVHQKALLTDKIKTIQASAQTLEFHFGDAIGADTEAAAIAFNLGCELHCHPPVRLNHEALITRISPMVVHKAKPPLDRNHDIVDASQIVFAAPASIHEVLRSGTWATIRYARKQPGVQLYILPPEEEQK